MHWTTRHLPRTCGCAFSWPVWVFSYSEVLWVAYLNLGAVYMQSGGAGDDGHGPPALTTADAPRDWQGCFDAGR